MRGKVTFYAMVSQAEHLFARNHITCTYHAHFLDPCFQLRIGGQKRPGVSDEPVRSTATAQRERHLWPIDGQTCSSNLSCQRHAWEEIPRRGGSRGATGRTRGFVLSLCSR